MRAPLRDVPRPPLASARARGRGRASQAATLLAGALLALTATAAEEFESLADPALQARYMEMIHEVRCLTCLNRSIAESETPLAHDLRREIRELIASGKSDREVVDFLTARYGDFVMYRPPMRPRTWALWFAPAAFVLIGVAIFTRIVSRRMRQPIEDDVIDADTVDADAGDNAEPNDGRARR